MRTLVAQHAALDEEPCPLWSQVLLLTAETLIQLVYPCETTTSTADERVRGELWGTRAFVL